MTASGPIVEEAVVRLVSEAHAVFEWRCTPADLTALAIGRLFIEGLVEDAGIATRLQITHSADGIVIAAPALGLPRELVRTSARSVDLPSTDQFSELFRALFATVDARHEGGGMHAAALARNGQIEYQADDVGRHNAVDKVVGLALLASASLGECGMLVSARISGEIARKAALSGVAWLASRSIPTTLAVQTAHAAGMTMIGRAAGKNAFVYT